ncbi:hypothetical protein RCL1_001524 [Eukaryota sp. TZLM3-RCL]
MFHTSLKCTCCDLSLDSFTKVFDLPSFEQGAHSSVSVLKNSSGTNFVLKTVPQSSTSAENELNYFKNPINSPYLVKYLHCFNDQHSHHFLLDYYELGSLKSYLSSSSLPLDDDDLLQLLVQLLFALNSLHSSNLLYRDLKPENILLVSTTPLIIKLCDFGVSIPINQTKIPPLAGTPGYIAPEILLGNSPGFASDYFSLGVLLYFLTQLKLPFDGSAEQDFSRPIIFDRNTSLELIIRGLLALNPQERPTFTDLCSNFDVKFAIMVHRNFLKFHSQVADKISSEISMLNSTKLTSFENRLKILTQNSGKVGNIITTLQLKSDFDRKKYSELNQTVGFHVDAIANLTDRVEELSSEVKIQKTVILKQSEEIVYLQNLVRNFQLQLRHVSPNSNFSSNFSPVVSDPRETIAIDQNFEEEITPQSNEIVQPSQSNSIAPNQSIVEFDCHSSSPDYSLLYLLEENKPLVELILRQLNLDLDLIPTPDIFNLLEELNVPNNSIENFTGIKCASNLKSLIIDPKISARRVNCDDVDEISSLKFLEKLVFPHYPWNFDFASNFKFLKYLDISYGSFSTVDFLSQNFSLEYLNISNNDKLESISPVGFCPLIKILIINNCININSLQRIETCSNLIEIYAKNCSKISSIRPLSGLPNLKIVDISDSELIDDVIPFTTCPQLSKLIMSNCKKIRDVSCLSVMKQLTFLDLSQTPIIFDCREFQSLNKLIHLNLASSEVEVINFDCLSSFIFLEFLDLTLKLDLNDISFLNHLTKLKELSLKCTNVVDLTPITSSINLISLDISHVFSIESIAPLLELPELKSLNIRSSNIPDLNLIGFMENLIDLDIGRVTITTISDLYFLSYLTGLQSLTLSNCKYLTDLSPIKDLIHLTFLDLSCCSELLDLSLVSSFKKLSTLILHNCYKIPCLEPISLLFQLNHLDISRIEKLDLTPLASCLLLSELVISPNVYDYHDINPIKNLVMEGNLALKLNKLG